MAEQETSPETPVTETPAESEYTSVANAVAASHTEDEIAEETLYEPDHVEAMESVPPIEYAADLPIEVPDMHERVAVAPVAPKAEAKPEKQLGPLTGSGWMLAISIVAFILAIIVQAL